MKKIRKIIVVVGPTATGKTELALNIADKFNTYIISGDSMQIYRHFHVGTAQPDLSKINIPYHLVNILEPEQKFSAYDFKISANEIINKNQTIPVIAGGTGFYINSFLNNYSLGYLDESSYQDFLSLNEHLNLSELKNRLKEKDPLAAQTVDLNNKRRVLRALAIKELTGKSINEQILSVPDFDPFLIGLNTNRSALYERIELRVDQMMNRGLLDEAEQVYNNRQKYPLLSTAIAYKEFFPYFDNTSDLNSSVELLKQKSRNYAKRQLTWFRNKMQVHWYDISEPNFYEQVICEIGSWLG